MRLIVFRNDREGGLGHPAQVDLVNPEVEFEGPHRLRLALSALTDLPSERNGDPSDDFLYAVHPEEYWQRLTAASKGSPDRRDFGTEFAVGPETIDACRSSMAAMFGAWEAVSNGGHAIVVTRPPGHHALPRAAMGFCAVNPVASLAVFLARRGRRVAIIDYDVHSGNGTIEAVGGEPNILFAEIRTRGDREYPYSQMSPFHARQLPYIYAPPSPQCVLIDIEIRLPRNAAGVPMWEHPSFLDFERDGAWHRVPGHCTTGQERDQKRKLGEYYLELATKRIIPAVTEFRPEFVLFSAGFDTLADDPIGDLGLYPDQLESFVGAMMAAVAVPSITFVEGGYSSGIVDGLQAVKWALKGL